MTLVRTGSVHFCPENGNAYSFSGLFVTMPARRVSRLTWQTTARWQRTAYIGLQGCGNTDRCDGTLVGSSREPYRGDPEQRLFGAFTAENGRKASPFRACDVRGAVSLGK